MPENITNIIAYSDSCGGQNKNKNIAKLFMYIVRTTHIQKIDHKFFEPGHSYMECDRSFALIEKLKNKNPQIFIPDHWCDLIKKCSKKFVVHKMTDFVSILTLNNYIKDPKTTTEKQPIKWRDIKWFSYNKAETFQFCFKNNLQDYYPFHKTEKCFKNVGRPLHNLTLEPLYQEKLKIKYEKWENLLKLLDFIPPIYHQFYKELPHEPKPQKNKKAMTTSTTDTSQTENGEDAQDNYMTLLSDYE